MARAVDRYLSEESSSVPTGDVAPGLGTLIARLRLRRHAYFEAHLSLLGVMVTLAAAAAFYTTLHLGRVISEPWEPAGLFDVLYLLIVSFLIYGSLVFLVCRFGYYRRLAAHRRRSQFELDVLFDDGAPSVIALVPSYKEDAKVISQTLLSVALQNYPRLRVVLLIDDPPHPTSPEDRAALARSRLIPGEIESILQERAGRYREAAGLFRSRQDTPAVEVLRLADLYAEAGRWFENFAASYDRCDHTDAVFIDRIILSHARTCYAVAASLRANRERIDYLRLDLLYRRLIAIFDVRLEAFERKRFENLSHAPNKAMNLNSYISLLGRGWRERVAPDGLHLEQDEDGERLPDADYVLTVDADSLVLPDYTLRMVATMEEPSQAGVAVVQTPYSAVPGPSSRIERIAGATTDLQYIIHQGFSQYRATFWVGANALLRRRALESIATRVIERGHGVRVYIQDRTVIEDTESSVDLIHHGWQLLNYPERLTYSATPPDFGSLTVQRHRWANGGLIIVPKLFRYLFLTRWHRRKLGEFLLRFHYLTSVATSSIGVMLLLVVPFSDRLATIWLPLTALSYFALYGRELRHNGYRFIDLARVYALNMLLLPVNVGGVLTSLRQWLTGRRIAFRRTPKIAGRTPSSPRYLLALFAIVAYSCFTLFWDLADGRYMHAVFSALNAGVILYAIVHFLGWRHAIRDCVRRPCPD